MSAQSLFAITQRPGRKVKPKDLILQEIYDSFTTFSSVEAQRNCDCLDNRNRRSCNLLNFLLLRRSPLT